jgi:hypothetical protein
MKKEKSNVVYCFVFFLLGDFFLFVWTKCLFNRVFMILRFPRVVFFFKVEGSRLPSKWPGALICLHGAQRDKPVYLDPCMRTLSVIVTDELDQSSFRKK